MTRACPLDRPELDELLEICRRTFQKPRADGTLGRQFHAKTHCGLRGWLTIDPPDDPVLRPILRHGLFAQPGRYPVVLRFSNSFFDDDGHPDLRGLALKLGGVAGEVIEGAPPGQQDFVLMNAATGPARDAKEALQLFRALDGIRDITAAAVMAPRYLFPDIRPWRMRWRYFRFLSASGLSHLLGQDLGAMTYTSVTCYRLGDGATKFLVRPDPATRKIPRGGSFQERLQVRLDGGPLHFDFRLQPKVLETDSLEDARIPWKSPIHGVGRLEIPPQDVAAGIALGESLSFSPWNALKAHEPLGTINAMRREAYAVSAGNRGATAVPPSWDSPPINRR